MQLAPVPSPGQLVTVRERRFVVTDVDESALQLDLYAPRQEQRPQHLLTLQSMDDDAHGEELQVVWELEPGVRVHETGQESLPDPREGLDPPPRLDAFLDAVRWGAVASADIRHLNAPFRSGIVIEDYQLDPVARALQMPRVSLLIGDDVGLGKTIEAGLVVQELILRHRARTVLVVCPAGLQIQWRDQMRDKFGLEFQIIDSAAMKDLRRRRGLHVNPWTSFPRLITSIDFLKRERPMRLFREVLPPEGEATFPRRFDLMIVDEAHNVAPSGRGKMALDSLRTQAVRTLAPHFEHKIFLTATPHNGYTESFTALLELLDDQRFHRGFDRPDRKQLAAVMVRRLKRELPPDDLGRPRFPERKLHAIEVPYTDDERNAHALLQRYSELRLSNTTDRVENLASEFVLKLLKKRLFSSPEAFKLTLERHEQALREGKAPKKTPTRRPTEGLLRREIEAAEEDPDDDLAYEERVQDVVEATSRVFRLPSAEEEKLLTQLREWASQASGKPDTKAERLLSWIEEAVRPNGKWGRERVIVFTEYRATQNWLHELLAARGLSRDGRLLPIYGGMPLDERERVKAEFQASPRKSKVRILLATDAASEGIDLQNHCSQLIHYEIPWNPNRMEQRNGRIDRHGQKQDGVHIHHFVAAGYEDHAKANRWSEPGDLDGDLEFLLRAALKVNQIREDLGNVGDVLSDQVEEAMLGRRRVLGDPEKGNPRAAEVKEMLRFERHLKKELERLHQRLEESRDDLRLSPDNIKAVVDVGLALADKPPLTPVEIPADDDQPAITAYRVPALDGTWAPCCDGLADPLTGEPRPIVFDHDDARGRDDVVLAHLNHRLVQMCLRLLRAEVWAPGDTRKLRRVSVRVVPDDVAKHPVALAHARLVVTGGDGQRLHEEVIAAGGALEKGQFTRFNVGQVDAALDAAQSYTDEAPESVKKRIAELYPDHARQLLSALQARMRDRATSLTNKLDERAKKDIADLRAVLTELRETILHSLEDSARPQLELFDPPEREQIERNRDALSRRAQQIPDEIEREVQAIKHRYADPTPRMFPVAVTYLVPRSQAR